MANAPAPQGRRGNLPGADADDGWGPATSVRSAYAQASASAAASPAIARQPISTPSVRSRREAPTYEPTQADLPHVEQPAVARSLERGLPAWTALLVLLGIAGIGGLIDTVSGAQVRGGFNIGIVVASVVAILVVKRSEMFPVVVAPPIVYSLASAAMLYIRSGGLHDRRVLFDGAANWLVYGFPAIAAATAGVLIIAGIRLLARR